MDLTIFGLLFILFLYSYYKMKHTDVIESSLFQKYNKEEPMKTKIAKRLLLYILLMILFWIFAFIVSCYYYFTVYRARSNVKIN